MIDWISRRPDTHALPPSIIAPSTFFSHDTATEERVGILLASEERDLYSESQSEVPNRLETTR
ncbi:hypothetical protein Golomagni_00461 [Golovinomyces magnicellulatus]|nr:hypothetical protein Golomagni_00461 [Golovinomyces magnicellulatus]